MKTLQMAFVLAALIVACGAVAQEQLHDMSQHAAHQQEMNARGEKAMGFSQTATTHHFILTGDGGYVQVTANNTADGKTVEQVRVHLMDIKKKFAEGNFAAPELTHGKVPPGVGTMQKLRGAITYDVKFMEGGGRLYMSSKNKDAVAALHNFLKFQIEDHGTGDPMTSTN